MQLYAELECKLTCAFSCTEQAEKGEPMGSHGELSKQKRQFIKNSEEVEPILISRNTSEDVAQIGRTDGFLVDDGEPPRRSTSAIRLDVPPDLRNRPTGSYQPASVVPPRRQQVQPKTRRCVLPHVQLLQRRKNHPLLLTFTGYFLLG